MSFPAGGGSLTPGDYGATNDGSIAGLSGRDQTTVTNAYTGQVTAGSWGGLGGGLLSLVLGLIDGIVNAILGGFTSVVDAILGVVDNDFVGSMPAVASKPDLTEIPISSPLWLSINPDEISSIPRANLHYGSSSATSSASGTSSHSHGLGQIPQYTPGGNGSDLMDIAYIRVPADRTISNIGWITGGSVTALGVNGFYAAVYSVNQTTGDLTRLAVSSNLSSAVGSTNTEYKFALGTTITAHQGDILAGCILQVTSIIQTCNSLLCQTITTLTPPSGQYPQRPYAYAGAYSTPPASITQATLNYTASNKVPFIALS